MYVKVWSAWRWYAATLTLFQARWYLFRELLTIDLFSHLGMRMCCRHAMPSNVLFWNTGYMSNIWKLLKVNHVSESHEMHSHILWKWCFHLWWLMSCIPHVEFYSAKCIMLCCYAWNCEIFENVKYLKLTPHAYIIWTYCAMWLKKCVSYISDELSKNPMQWKSVSHAMLHLKVIFSGAWIISRAETITQVTRINRLQKIVKISKISALRLCFICITRVM